MPEASSIYETLPQSVKQGVNDSQGLIALNNLKKFRGRNPVDFDMKAELAAARDEKYGL